MALSKKQQLAQLKKIEPPKRKPPEGHRPVMVNLPVPLIEKIDGYYKEDGYTDRSEWLRVKIREICEVRG